jgi:hypothetical protein
MDFPFFEDSSTALCSVGEDCEQYLTYSLEWKKCCDDDGTNCDDTCTGTGWSPTWIAQPDITRNADQTFSFESQTASTVMKYKARIVAQSSYDVAGANKAYSDEFTYWHDGYPQCSTATLNAAEAANVPGFDNKLTFNVDNTGETTFAEFGNDICPEFCYNPDN